MRKTLKRRLLLLATVFAFLYCMFIVPAPNTGSQSQQNSGLSDFKPAAQSEISNRDEWNESRNLNIDTSIHSDSAGKKLALSKTMDVVNVSFRRDSGEQATHSLKNNHSLQCFDKQGFMHIPERMSHSNLKDLLQAKNDLVYIPHWQRKFRTHKNKNGNEYLLKHRADSPRYYLTSVVRLRLYKEDKAKLTIAELKQWLHYQFWAGTQHVYICNHFLNESERIDKHLTLYLKLGLVTIYPWTDIKALPGSPNYVGANAANQVGCYTYIRQHHGNETVWQYNMDMDEYPYCPKDRCEGFLTRYLQKLEHEEATQSISELRVANFVLHGQGDRSRDIMIDRINRITPQQTNHLVKTIYKTADVGVSGMHGMSMRRGKTVYPNPITIKMLHYHGARDQNWGPDTEVMKRSTVEFNDVRYSIAVYVRNSLVAFNEVDAFSNKSGP